MVSSQSLLGSASERTSGAKPQSGIIANLVAMFPMGPHGAPDATASTATVALQALQQSGVTGTLKLAAVADGGELTGEIDGLEPGSKHGFHIHEKGDCSAPDGSSAGGHFNPAHTDHGAVEGASHVGDLGNVVANDEGVATVSVLKHGATLTQGDTAVVGRAVIVHAGEDDLKTQPTGGAGARVACGVIVASE
jgi:Cu-Zn family superoxide dismutase